MKKLLAFVLALCALCPPAGAQNAITQEGTVLQNSPMMFRGNNRARQGATVNGAPTGQTVTTGDSVVGGRCDYSAPTDAAEGYYRLCLDAANGRITLDGTKIPAKDLEFVINGQVFPLNPSAPSASTSFNPITYGALCDGTTDDTAAFRTMIAAFNSAGGGVIELPKAHICKVNLSAGPFILTAGGRVLGHGIPGLGGGLTVGEADMTGSSVLRDVSGSSVDIFQIQTPQSIEFSNFLCDAMPKRTGGACLAFQGIANTDRYSRSFSIDRMQFRNVWDGVRIDYSATWSITRSLFADMKHCGVVVDQKVGGGYPSDTADYGSGNISGNWFWDLAGEGVAGYCHYTGSLGPIHGNDFTGSRFGIFLNWSSPHSEELRATSNLFNNQHGAGIGIFQASAGKDLSEVIIANNQFTNQAFSAVSGLNPEFGNIYVGGGAPASYDRNWVKLLNITGNTFNNCYNNSRGAQAFIWLRAGDGVNISGNNGTQNHAPGSLPCQTDMAAGVAAIKTEGTSYAGLGVVRCEVGNNVWANMANYEYGGMAPLCVVNDTAQQTWAIDPHIGYGRISERLVDLTTTTSWRTLLTLVPSAPSGLNASGAIRATLSGHTGVVGLGTRTAEWVYFYKAGVPSVALFRPDVCGDADGGNTKCPQFRLVVSGSNILLQVQSSDGTSAMDSGTALIRTELAAVQNVATTFTWTLQ